VQLERYARLLRSDVEWEQLLDELHAAIPEDDEPISPEELGAIREAEQDRIEGRVIAHSEVIRRLASRSAGSRYESE
jgi:hypothetical protein